MDLLQKGYFAAEIERWGKVPSTTLCSGVSAMSFCTEAIDSFPWMRRLSLCSQYIFDQYL